jgi:hypothetical protein
MEKAESLVATSSPKVTPTQAIFQKLGDVMNRKAT